MTAEITFVVRKSPDGGFDAHALGHSIFTQADTIAELREMVDDAVQCHFDEEDRPLAIRLQFESAAR